MLNVSVYSKYPGVQLSLNTAWSSSQNAGGHRILALQAQLVTAHGKTVVGILPCCIANGYLLANSYDGIKLQLALIPEHTL